MNLEQMVEELRENILRDTSDAVVKDSDSYLLTDKSLVRYIDDAQNQFASRTLFLRDETTPAVTRITLVPGQESYALDSRVVSVYGARTKRRNLGRTTYASMTSGPGDFSSSGTVLNRAHNGCALYFYTDRETGRIGIYPAPDETYAEDELVLRVARLPLVPLLVTNLKAEPEIPPQYHLDMLEWAAWRALRNHDAEIENIPKASMHKKRFEDTVLELSRQAKRLLLADMQFNVQTNWSR